MLCSSSCVIPPIDTCSSALTNTLSAADLGLETDFDRSDGPTRATGMASKEGQTVFSLGEIGVRAAAGLALNISDNVLILQSAGILREIHQNEKDRGLPV
jgi:hypothetical protein